MSTAPTATPRERVLVGGTTGSAKTYSFLKIAEGIPDKNHVVIEVDDGFIKILINEFPKLGAMIQDYDDDTKTWKSRIRTSSNPTLTIYHCQSFTAVRAAQAEIEKGISNGTYGVGSWMCIDGIDLLYNNMRYAILNKAMQRKRSGQKEALDDAWEQALAVRSTGAPVLEGGDWDMVNSFYESFLTYCAFQIPMHLYVTTSVATIQERSPYEQKDTKDFYKQLGVTLKFEGQKRTARVFDTLVVLTHDPSGYYAKIWKDRGGQGRKWAQNPQHTVDSLYTNNNFYIDIGQKLFGW